MLVTLYIFPRREKLAEMTERPDSLRPLALGGFLLSDFRFMSWVRKEDGNPMKVPNEDRLFWFKDLHLAQFGPYYIVADVHIHDD